MEYPVGAKWSVAGGAAIALLFLMSVVVRFYRLGRWSFWIDEIFTVRHAQDGLKHGLAAVASAHPLYYWCTMVAFRWMGISEFSARLTSAAVGALSIPLLALAIRPFVAEPTAILFAGLLGVAPWHIYWSQNARFYTLTLLLQSLALIVLFRAVEAGNWFYLLVYLALYALAALTHETSIVSVAVVAIYLASIWILPEPLPVGMTPAFALTAIFAPVLIALLFFVTVGGGPTQRMRKIKHDWAVHYSHPGANPAWVLLATLRYIGFPIVWVACASVVLCFDTWHRFDWLMAAQALVPLVGVTAGARFAYSTTRYAFLALPAFIYFVARAVTAAAEINVWFGVLLVPLLLLTLYDDLSLYYFVNHGNRERWREMAARVAAQLRDGDLIYSTAPDLVAHYLKAPVHWLGNQSPESLSRLSTRTWFVVDNSLAHLPEPVQSWLNEYTRLVAADQVQFHARSFHLSARCTVDYVDPLHTPTY